MSRSEPPRQRWVQPGACDQLCRLGDELFAASYAIALGLFALFTWGTNAYANAAPEDRSAVSARIDRTDLIFQTLAVTFFLGVAITAWMRF